MDGRMVCGVADKKATLGSLAASEGLTAPSDTTGGRL